MRRGSLTSLSLAVLLLPAFLSSLVHGGIPDDLYNADGGDWLIGALLDCGPPGQTHYGQKSPSDRPAKDLVLQCTTDEWRRTAVSESRVWRMDYEDRPYECWNCNCAVYSCKIANGKMPFTPMQLGTSVQHFWSGVETAGRKCACYQVSGPCLENAIRALSSAQEYAKDEEQHTALLQSPSMRILPSMAQVDFPEQATLSQPHTNKIKDWYPTENDRYLIGSIEDYCNKYSHYIYIKTGNDATKGAMRCYDVLGWQVKDRNEDKSWNFDDGRYNCHTDQVMVCASSTIGHNVGLVQLIGNNKTYWNWAGVSRVTARWSRCTKQAAVASTLSSRGITLS